MRFSPSLLVFAITISASPALGCETSGRGAIFGSAVSMHVHPSETCSFTFSAPGSGGFGMGGTSTRMSTVISALRVLSQPAHGRAGTAGRNGVAYVAPANYRGSDNFQVELTSERGTVQVPVIVEVR